MTFIWGPALIRENTACVYHSQKGMLKSNSYISILINLYINLYSLYKICKYLNITGSINWHSSWHVNQGTQLFYYSGSSKLKHLSENIINPMFQYIYICVCIYYIINHWSIDLLFKLKSWLPTKGLKKTFLLQIR